MKKLRKLSLHQLDEVELGKRQEGLLFGGGTTGECKCGSCSTTGGAPSQVDNRTFNWRAGYTISGSNPEAECMCKSGAVYNAVSVKPGF